MAWLRRFLMLLALQCGGGNRYECLLAPVKERHRSEKMIGDSAVTVMKWFISKEARDAVKHLLCDCIEMPNKKPSKNIRL